MDRERTTCTRHISLAFVACATIVGALACASGVPVQPTPVQPIIAGRTHELIWPVKTREHVDLWLHGFALLSRDSSAVPLFKRGYRDEMTVLKNQANILTQLDVNHDKLANRVATSRSLINAQFVPFYFSSLEEMRGAIDRFVSSDGNPGAAKTQLEAAQFAVLAGYFPSAADRSWLALFSSALWDEDAKFYHSYWLQQQRERANVIDSTTAMWQHLVRPRLTRYLNNTQQRDGDILLSLPLGGEGRTLSATGTVRAAIAVNFPARPSDVPDAMYAIAHELIGPVANNAIADNTSPAEQRNGDAEKLSGPASVRGGLMLLEKFVPELADGYARYYITESGIAPDSNPRAQLAARFPIPDTIRDAIARQINNVTSGI